MGTIGLTLYYAPSDVGKYMLYMMDSSQDKFLQGMAYVLADAAIEVVLTVVLFKFVRRSTNIDIVKVGMYLLDKDALYYASITLTAVLYYLSVFLQHNGVDSTFEFAWLRANATNGTAHY